MLSFYCLFPVVDYGSGSVSKKDEKLKELESKVEFLSEQLRTTEKLLLFTQGLLQDTTTEIAVWNEERRKESEMKSEKLQLSLYYKGLVLGLLFGLTGNLLVSYFMKLFDFVNIPLWSWIVSLICILAGVLVLILLMSSEIKKISAQAEQKKVESPSTKKEEKVDFVSWLKN
jgi:hypothetical protein